MSRGTSLSGHHSASPKSEIHLTPPEIIEALGGPSSFDLDPCRPFRSPIPTARRGYSWVFQDGLTSPWFGRVYLNPPFTASKVGLWLRRLADHGCGVALISARTDTRAFHSEVFERASALLFLAGRYHFHNLAGVRHAANSGAPLVLCSYGFGDAEVLGDFSLPGQFIPLRLPRSFAVLALAETWPELVASILREESGPVRLSDLYRRVRRHPKARGNRHVEAKVRQVLQQGAGRRIAPGVWEAAA